MKSFNELMAQCPKHDCAYVLYNKRWHRIEELLMKLCYGEGLSEQEYHEYKQLTE